MEEPSAPADPVFVLCMARSGSTLLRFLLDAHPDLACPPETELPTLCRQLTQTWAVLAGTPPEGSRDGEPPEIPGPLRVNVRHVIEGLMRQHLARRGKTRFCDKSLFTARHVDLLTQVFPGARFICLYRHPMDLIASGLEACPWGLKGFGFDSYAAGSPGNGVLALARFWADHAREIRDAEERYPGRCHRVRYEDLVADPESVAEGIFGFLGVRPSPGISARCLTPDRERTGPGDYKIWQTSRITADSVGRGWSIPPERIEQPVRDRINRLAAGIGYVPVDQAWGIAGTPPDLRADARTGLRADARAGDGRGAAASSARASGPAPRVFSLLDERLQAGLFRMGDGFLSLWGSCAAERFLVVAAAPDGDDRVARWRVDLAARTVTLAGAATGGAVADEPVSWQLTGSAACWEQLLAGTANLNVALRRRELRYADTGTVAGPVTVKRIDMLSDLLAITSWRPGSAPPALPAPPVPALPATAASPATAA